MKKPFKPNAADFLFHKFSVAKQPKERSLSKVESEIRMRILGLDYEENAHFLLILTVFLVRVHFFYTFFPFIRFQKCKKSVPLRGKCTFFTNFDCFPRKGTLFLLFFSIYQISKESKKCTLTRKMHLFY